MGAGLVGIRILSASVAAMVIIGYSFIWLVSDDVPAFLGIREKDPIKRSIKEKRSGLDQLQQQERMRGDYFDPREDLMTEVPLEDGRKFKLYEKKPLNHKKAKSYCKKREGKLAQAGSLDEMKRLQLLLMRARRSNEIWMGADRKDWKGHAQRINHPRHDFGPEIMQMGGGMTDMCPAMSSSTRSLLPVDCAKELPFICEYPKGKPGTPPPTPKVQKPKKASKGMPSRNRLREEMRRRRKRQISSDHTVIPIGVPEDTLSITDNPNDIITGTTTPISAVVATIIDEVTEDVTEDSKMDEERKSGHDIGFTPHILSRMDMINELPDEIEGDAAPPYWNSSGVNQTPEEDANAKSKDFFAKVSTKILIERSSDEVADSEDMSQGHLMVEGTSQGHLVADEEPTSDPDQVLMNLIDEQIESMALIDFDTEEVDENSTIFTTPRPLQSEGVSGTEEEPPAGTLEVSSPSPSPSDITEGQEVAESTSQTPEMTDKPVRKNSKIWRHGKVTFNLPEVPESNPQVEAEATTMMMMMMGRKTLLRPTGMKDREEGERMIEEIGEEEMSSTGSGEEFERMRDNWVEDTSEDPTAPVEEEEDLQVIDL